MIETLLAPFDMPVAKRLSCGTMMPTSRASMR
jgi:hypothetical protein